MPRIEVALDAEPSDDCAAKAVHFVECREGRRPPPESFFVRLAKDGPI
ncbi:hypothetical protein HYPDE_38853 [Hyphomicrobium denitrificans 1NES1]|uniref:Uncharacterized protein n=1 Tax=Hyphomicrobium denitrificans 1NES1 TaxID=670307 RepID=N0BH30_9HYPH|nr:hypothetical protein HYPDE_38853 [Hyphomicrobium denitrificans 1NES1]